MITGFLHLSSQATKSEQHQAGFWFLLQAFNEVPGGRLGAGRLWCAREKSVTPLVPGLVCLLPFVEMLGEQTVVGYVVMRFPCQPLCTRGNGAVS